MASSSSSSSSFSPSPAHVDAFSRDGFVVLPSFWSPATIARVRGAADALLASYDPATTPRSVFSTDEQQRHSDAYFLASGDNVSFFFEAEAVDASTGALLVPKERAINKIGHNLHELVPAFREVSLEDARLGIIARALGFERPLDRLDLTADAPHPAQQLLFVPDRMSHPGYIE